MRCFLISSLFVLVSSPAVADRKISPAAAIELERGEKKFRDKDYAAAIAAFEAGYALDPQPIFLYDKAQAQRLSGDCQAAIATYKAFLATNPAANEATRARKNIASCEATLPLPEPEPTLSDELEPVSPAPIVGDRRLTLQPVTEERSWWHDRVGVTLVTSGVVALGVGAGFAIAARQASADTALARDVDEWTDRHDAWHRNRIIAGVAAGAGAALVTLAAIRFAVHDRTVRVAATGGAGAVVAVGGHW